MNQTPRHILSPDGTVLRREALNRGVDDNALGRMVRSGVLVRLRQGVYAERRTFLDASDLVRHQMLCRAVMRMYGGHVALSHCSAAVMQGGPDYGLDLASVRLTHFEGGGRRQSRITHHSGECRVGDVRRSEGMWVTVPGRCVLEIASVCGAEAALVQANHFLHRGETTLEELRAQQQRQERWPGSLTQHPVMFLARPEVESVLESRGLYFFWRQALPMPELQFEVFHPDGKLAGRTDFVWHKERVLGEVDGLVKYHRLRREGETIEEMVMREKRREDLLRRLTGYQMIRLVASDLNTPLTTAHWVRQALRDASALRAG